MYWKQGLATMALGAFLLSGEVIAQERQDDNQRTGAAAGAQDRDQERANQRDQAEQQGQQRQQVQPGQGQQFQREQQAQRGEQGEQWRKQLDKQIAYGLLLGNWEEVQLSEFAASKSQNPQVKEFAHRMVQEHNRYMDRLKNFLPSEQDDPRARSGSATGARSATGAADAAVSQQARDNANPANDQAAAQRQQDAQESALAQAQIRQQQEAAAQPGQTGQQGQFGEQGQERLQAQAGQQGQHGQIMMQIHRDAAERCLELTKEVLSEKQGADFDMAYVGQQIVAHIGMLSKMQAAQEHVSPELQEIVRQGTQAAEQHLKEARTLAESLAQASPQGARPGAQPGRTEGQPGAQPGRNGVQVQPGAPERQPLRNDQ